MTIRNPKRCSVSINCSRIAMLAALTVAIAGASFSARAGESPEDEAFQKKLFGRAVGEKQTIHACFNRVYDPAHLAQHPQQNVRTMRLLVKVSQESDGTNYGVRIGVMFRKSGAHFESAGDCSSIHDSAEAGNKAGVAHCGVDCDGGSIDVAIKDAKSVLVSIPDGARIWRPGSDGDEPGNARKRFGADDKVFRVDKVALTQCLELADDNKEKAAMRRGQ
jgi:hypothetical protein